MTRVVSLREEYALELFGGGGLVTKSCPTFCDPMDYSLPGFSVHGIAQARILEWVDISFSRGSSQSRDQTQVSTLQTGSLPLSHKGRPYDPKDVGDLISGSSAFSYIQYHKEVICK